MHTGNSNLLGMDEQGGRNDNNLNQKRIVSTLCLASFISMGVGKLQGSLLSVGNLKVVVFVGNLTGGNFRVGNLPPSP